MAYRVDGMIGPVGFLFVMAADQPGVSPNVGTIMFLGAMTAGILTMALPIFLAWRVRQRPEREQPPESFDEED